MLATYSPSTHEHVVSQLFGLQQLSAATSQLHSSRGIILLMRGSGNLNLSSALWLLYCPTLGVYTLQNSAQCPKMPLHFEQPIKCPADASAGSLG
jgi:hypothetical protein